MDTFWESVKRDERAMTRKRVLIIAGVVMVAVAVIVSPIAAKHQEPAAVCETQDPGTLPDSPLYFVKNWKRSIHLSFTFDTREKAALSLKFADEDALAISALCDKEEYILGGKECGRFQAQFDRTLEWVEEARQKGKNVEELIDGVEDDHLWQQQVLGAALGKAPEWAKEAVLIAIVNSSSALESTIGGIEGEQAVERFRQKLNLQFSSLDEETQIKIRQKLDMPTGEPVNGDDSLPNPVKVPPAVNQPPVIISLIPDEDSLSPKESCHIECCAEDPDGDSLDYEWLVEKGDIAGTGSVITWTAPGRDGSYDITVVVSDGRGGEVTELVTIDLVRADPPRIEKVIVTAEHKYLEEFMLGYIILKDRSCELECVVEDTSAELSYEWEAPRGEFSGTGSQVTWTAPGSKGEVIITVTVFDSSGREDSESVLFSVSTCARCFN